MTKQIDPFFVAGLKFHGYKEIQDKLTPGTMLTLVPEPDNTYDAHAIRIELEGRMLGYVPKAINQQCAGATNATVVMFDPAAKSHMALLVEITP